MSSLRRGHANLLCIVPILTDDPRRESESTEHKSRWTTGTQLRKTPSQPKVSRNCEDFPEVSRRFPGNFPDTGWADCTQSGPAVHSLGRLYAIWADCTQSGPTVDFVERLGQSWRSEDLHRSGSGPHGDVSGLHGDVSGLHGDVSGLHTSQVPKGTFQVPMGTSQVSMETSQVSMETSQVPMETSQVPMGTSQVRDVPRMNTL